jgi:ATP-dependent RNA helicase RhlE
MNQGFISLKDIRYFVLDEADHMLDMGFIHDIKKVIAKLPKERQSLFFSATMPPEIVELSKDILGTPEKITIRPQQATADRVEQALYFVSKKDKPELLLHLLKTESVDSALIFSRTKYGADKIVKFLGRSEIKSAAIHGNKSQGARQKALGNFKSGDTNILVATDIAARGIDVDDLSHVINFDLPNVPETYVHRIGRTGRASASGIAISFCDGEERAFLKDIQKLIAQDIEVISEHPYVDENPVAQAAAKPSQNRSSNRPYRGNARGGNRSYGNASRGRNSRRPNSSNRGA